MTEPLLIPRKMWNDALDQAQKKIPWYDLHFATREFTRMMLGLRR